MSAIRLPEPHYYTLEELAVEYGCHPSRIRGYLDAGYCFPAALIPKSVLPQLGAMGPAPHFVVLLPDYRTMPWTPVGDTCVTTLAGEFVAFSVDRDAWSNFVLDAPGVQITLEDLVITRDQKEELEAYAAILIQIRDSPIKKNTRYC